jgi:TATA-box binding protein (TBP) (component of TFIID and TFIIIB)
MEFKEKPYLDESYFDESILPKNKMNISTISLSFQMNTIVDIDNISKYIELKKNGICSIDYKGKQKSINVKKKKKKRKENNFYNSITIVIMGIASESINFKLFKNGGVQAAGCKNIIDGNFAIYTLVSELSKEFAIFDKTTQKMTDVKFILQPIKVSDLKINLINVNLKLRFHINRESLHKILLSTNTPCSFEKCEHAGVKIKFTPSNKITPIHILIFESGSIVITGSKNEKHILESYNYVTNLIMSNKKEISKRPYEELLFNVLNSNFKHLMIQA